MSDEIPHTPPGDQPNPVTNTVVRSHPETLPEPLAGATAVGTGVFAPLRAGAVSVPGYEIMGELGRGGMGVVYKARQLKLNRVVALKMLLNGALAESRELIRFLGEGEAVASIRHPHIIQVYDLGESDGHPFIALECLEGGSLVEHLRAHGKLAPHAAAELVLKLASGVQAAHEHDIVHRDLKPHNVLFDLPPTGSPPGTLGEPKVMDFGIMKHGSSDLTQTGAILGTPAYMAPEQARGETKTVGPAADIYSLGVILYECLTGTVPFSGADAWAVIRQVINDEPQPASRRAENVPRELDLICQKCLAKEPTERYVSAAALAADLRRFLMGERVRDARTGAWHTTRRFARRRWRPVAAVLAGVVVLAAVGVLVTAKKPERKLEEDQLVKLRREEVNRRVEFLRQSAPAPDTEAPHRPIATLPDLPAPDLTAFHVITDERTVDMRGWRPLPPDDPDARCYVIYQTRRQVVKDLPANEFRAEMRTSGFDVFLRGMQPDPKKVKAFASQKEGHVGKQAMKIRQLGFDVTDVPVKGEFTVQFSGTYVNSLQTPEEQWFGVIGYERSFKISMLMLFPADRPFREYELLVAPTRQDDPTQREDPRPYTGPVITFAADDNSWVYWEIPDPKANYVYRVDWTW